MERRTMPAGSASAANAAVSGTTRIRGRRRVPKGTGICRVTDRLLNSTTFRNRRYIRFIYIYQCDRANAVPDHASEYQWKHSVLNPRKYYKNQRRIAN